MSRCEERDEGNKRVQTRRPRRKLKELRIAWCNVRKALTPHATLLEVCWKEGVDVVQVQEPWTRPDTKTQNHMGYESYAPVDSWVKEDERLRVMTYVKKNSRIKA